MRRHLRILGVQLRRSLLVAMQYRLNFLFEGLMACFWTVTAIVPLFVLFQDRKTIAGWAWNESLLVVACFTLLKGLLSGAIQPSLQAVVEAVRRGTLDFLLLKPADAQFLVSTANFELWRGSDALAGIAVLGYALMQFATFPPISGFLIAGLLLLGAVVILYSLWILVVALAFRFVKVDNLSFLFLSLYDAARWPSNVFRGVFSWLFTFVIPLALMTTYPALALLGRLTLRDLATALLVALVFAAVSRVAWQRSIKHYTSAGG